MLLKILLIASHNTVENTFRHGGLISCVELGLSQNMCLSRTYVAHCMALLFAINVAVTSVLPAPMLPIIQHAA